MDDVAIVGAGPVGLTLANLLGRRGISVRLFEKQTAPYPLPRAVHFDGEVMRCFQAAGVATDILPHTHVGKGMLFQDKNGKTLLDWSRDQSIGPMGWYESYRFFQPDLEDTLRLALQNYANVSLHTGAEICGVDQTNDDVTLRQKDGSQFKAKYVVACDGASSQIRESLDIGLHDLGFQERWLVVDAQLKRNRDDLGDYSIQYCDPETPATYLRGVGTWRRWEMRMQTEDPDPMPDHLIWHRLARWITPADAVLRRGAVYEFRSRIAHEWRKGRIFLAGDAAHQMPPFMGQGMCAGIRDVANLWWKLCAVLNGSNSDILDSYHSERSANVHAFIGKSMQLGRLINQTATGQSPRGQMSSIWPDLGSGLGERDGSGGVLVPQIRESNGQLADTMAKNRFYVISLKKNESIDLPIIIGNEDWLKTRGLEAAIVRPDGYCFMGIKNWESFQAADMASVSALVIDRTLR